MGRELSGVFVATLCGLLMSNLGVIPCSAAEYSVVNGYLLPLAIPMLLYSANLKRVLTDTGALLPIFITGAVATVVASLAAISIVPLSSLGENGWKIAAALCARHIGGAVNYVAVTVGLGAEQTAVSAGLAADNLICGLYFSALYALARNIPTEAAAVAESKKDIVIAVCFSSLHQPYSRAPLFRDSLFRNLSVRTGSGRFHSDCFRSASLF